MLQTDGRFVFYNSIIDPTGFIVSVRSCPMYDKFQRRLIRHSISIRKLRCCICEHFRSLRLPNSAYTQTEMASDFDKALQQFLNDASLHIDKVKYLFHAVVTPPSDAITSALQEVGVIKRTRGVSRARERLERTAASLRWRDTTVRFPVLKPLGWDWRLFMSLYTLTQQLQVGMLWIPCCDIICGLQLQL